MSAKRITGLIALIVGIILITYSIHSRNRISNAKSEFHSLSQSFSGSSAGKAAGNWLQNEAGQYDVPVMVLLISGIVLTVIGGGAIIFGKRKNRRR
jgi:hypothetical protein